jgi:hypothetical protein
MSQKELQRAEVIENAAGGRLSVREASRLLQRSERQVQRLKRWYQPDSIAWAQHGNRVAGRRGLPDTRKITESGSFIYPPGQPAAVFLQ